MMAARPEALLDRYEAGHGPRSRPTRTRDPPQLAAASGYARAIMMALAERDFVSAQPGDTQLPTRHPRCTRAG